MSLYSAAFRDTAVLSAKDTTIEAKPSFVYQTNFECKVNQEDQIVEQLTVILKSIPNIDFRFDRESVRIIGFDGIQQVDMSGKIFKHHIGGDNNTFHCEFHRRSGCAILFNQIYHKIQEQFALAPRSNSCFVIPTLSIEDSEAYEIESLKDTLNSLMSHLTVSNNIRYTIDTLHSIATYMTQAKPQYFYAAGFNKSHLSSLIDEAFKFINHDSTDDIDTFLVDTSIISRTASFFLIFAVLEKFQQGLELNVVFNQGDLKINDIVKYATNCSLIATEDAVPHVLTPIHRELLRQYVRVIAMVKTIAPTTDLSESMNYINKYAEGIKSWPRFEICKDAFETLNL